MQTVKLSPGASVQPSRNVSLDMALSVIRDILWRDIARATDVTVLADEDGLTITIAGVGMTIADTGKPKFSEIVGDDSAEMERDHDMARMQDANQSIARARLEHMQALADTRRERRGGELQRVIRQPSAAGVGRNTAAARRDLDARLDDALGKNWMGWQNVPHYSTNIQVAFTLWRHDWRLRNTIGGWCVESQSSGDEIATGCTPAEAIATAALAALEAEHDD